MGKEDEIKIIAYSIWEQDGCCDGHDCEHWLKAEAIWEGKHKKADVPTGTKKKFNKSKRQGRKDKEGRLMDDAYYTSFPG